MAGDVLAVRLRFGMASDGCCLEAAHSLLVQTTGASPALAWCLLQCSGACCNCNVGRTCVAQQEKRGARWRATRARAGKQAVVLQLAHRGPVQALVAVEHRVWTSGGAARHADVDLSASGAAQALLVTPSAGAARGQPSHDVHLLSGESPAAAQPCYSIFHSSSSMHQGTVTFMVPVHLTDMCQRVRDTGRGLKLSCAARLRARPSGRVIR